MVKYEATPQNYQWIGHCDDRKAISLPAAQYAARSVVATSSEQSDESKKSRPKYGWRDGEYRY